jgi:hypothetical protein
MRRPAALQTAASGEGDENVHSTSVHKAHLATTREKETVWAYINEKNTSTRGKVSARLLIDISRRSVQS